MEIRDQNDNYVNTQTVERLEQELAKHYIKGNNVVLELGARYGSVSCTINSLLNNKKNQVSVEPDARVWEALRKNKIRNNCDFHVVKGFISNKKLDLINKDVYLGGYGASFVEDKESSIPSYSLDEIRKKYNLNFDALVADCEGFLEEFLDENPDLYDTIKIFIFEEDYPEKCNYQKIFDKLKEKNFKLEFHEGQQYVWLKE